MPACTTIDTAGIFPGSVENGALYWEIGTLLSTKIQWRKRSMAVKPAAMRVSAEAPYNVYLTALHFITYDHHFGTYRFWQRFTGVELTINLHRSSTFISKKIIVALTQP